MTRLQERPSSGRQACPLCRDRLDGEVEPLHTCAGCQTQTHLACAKELGGCATLGCAMLQQPTSATVRVGKALTEEQWAGFQTGMQRARETANADEERHDRTSRFWSLLISAALGVPMAISFADAGWGWTLLMLAVVVANVTWFVHVLRSLKNGR